MSQKCVAFVETGNFRDFSDGIVKELSVYIMLVPETLYKELSTFSTGFSTKAKTGTAQSFSTILPVIYQTAKQGSAQGEIRQISLHNHIISGFGSKAVLLADMTEVVCGGLRHSHHAGRGRLRGLSAGHQLCPPRSPAH